MNVTLEDVVSVVASHVAKSPGLNAPIDADTSLYDNGLIDSFGVLEVIAAIETAAGVPIPDGALAPDDFESPRTLFLRLKAL